MSEEALFSDEEKSLADARVILLACGPVLECFFERFGERIPSPEVRTRTKSASSIIVNQIGHDGCMAMEGFEVQDLLCRLSGLYNDLANAMKAIKEANAATFASMMAKRLGIYCGRFGGGDKRGYKAQKEYSATQDPNRQPTVPIRPPSPGRMGG